MRLSVLPFAFLPLFAQDPTDSRGWLQKGVQAFQNANYTEAVQDFERSLALEPTFLEARLYLGTAYMQQYTTPPSPIPPSAPFKGSSISSPKTG